METLDRQYDLIFEYIESYLCNKIYLRTISNDQNEMYFTWIGS